MDSLPEPGGQVSALYPEKLIYDVAGFPAVKGQELIERCVDQAAPYDPVYLLNHRAQTLDAHEDGSFTVTTHRGTVVETKAVMITGGIGTFTPRPLPDGEQFRGPRARLLRP
jgi:ferredoxin/flavodoxin---NADP+ reductase